jgi:hypothetical protein
MTTSAQGFKPLARRGWNEHFFLVRRVELLGLTLALLVARVGADDHDPPVAPDDPALLADLLHARLDLHGLPFSF